MVYVASLLEFVAFPVILALYVVILLTVSVTVLILSPSGNGFILNEIVPVPPVADTGINPVPTSMPWVIV